MAKPIDTLKQRTETVPNGDGVILVRRMYHKPAREFVKKLAGVLRERASLLGRGADGSLLLTSLDQITELVTEVDALAEHLVHHSTDDLADTVDFVTWLEVLAAALRLNCGTDLKNSLAAIGAALAPLLAADPTTKTNSGAAPTPSSSTPATTPAI